jgi:hypothetical protein
MRDGHGGDRDQGGADDDGALERRVAAELVRRGELLPTTEAEVLAAEREGVEHEGDLPPALRRLGERSSPPRSHRVVALDEVRRRRAEARSGWASHAGSFALGAAAAAALLLVTRDRTPTPLGDRRAAGGPSATTSAAPPEVADEARIVIAPVTACGGPCCAGARCDAAKGELRRCASGRACIACDEGAEVKSAFRLRLGDLVPAAALSADAVRALDLCARVGGGAWSCAPARPEGGDGQGGRVLPGTITTADLAAGLDLELRPRGGKQVVGRWREAVRVGPTVLCHGAGALLANDRADLGSLSITLEPAHWVEIERAGATGPLRALRRRLELADVDPVLVETTSPGAARFALAVGPLDADVAERLRWALLDHGLDVRVTLGADHQGAPQKLPAPTPKPPP